MATAPRGHRTLRASMALRWRRAGIPARTVACILAVIVLASLITGVVLAIPAPAHHATATPTTITTTTTTTPSTSTTKPKGHAAAAVCPLTGTPPPAGKVPERPALAVKIGNDPSSRPQSGLTDADVVYEEMAEGGVTRYMAIFQCHVPAAIGPVRSVRWDDWHILQSYGHPILAFAGGIQQWEDTVAGLGWLFDANGLAEPGMNAYYRTSDRIAPWNYYTSGSALWGLDSRNHTPPPSQFTYSKKAPGGTAVGNGVSITGFASDSTVVWQWSGRSGSYLRYYGSQADVDISGAQLRATNVVIQMVATQPGPYPESAPPPEPDVESLTQGSGPVWILRDGRVEKGTWSCRAYGDVTQYQFPNRKAMTLQPGNTWVELVPDKGYPVNIIA